MKKRKTFFVLAAAVALQSTVAFAESFPDVSDSYWGAAVIEQMKEKNILDGYEDGTFRPENSLTRAECAKLLCAVAELEDGNAEYTDVSEDAWYFDYVRDCGKYMFEGKAFEPDKKITREEFASAVCRVLGLSEVSAELDFSDSDGIKNKGLVAAAVENGFISGFEDGTFRGNDPLSRAQCCSMLSRAFFENGTEELPNEPEEVSEWTATKLTNTKLEDFSHNVIADENGKIILIEKDEKEVVFEINLPEGELNKKTSLETRKFIMKTADAPEGVGYSDFTPMQLIYDEYTSKTLLFGKFGTYTDENGNKTDAEKYVTLDFTIRIEKYTEFDDEKIKYSSDREPALLAMFRDKYAVVFDGAHTVYRFKADDGTRVGECFRGDEGSVKASFADENYLYVVDDNMNFMKFNMYSRELEGEIRKIDAYSVGMRNGVFWFWNREKGEIFTLKPSGEEKVIYENVGILSDEEIDFDKLDRFMLVINDGKFLLYDGASLYIMEKINA